MDKLLNEFTGMVRRAVDDYEMIQEGDKVMALLVLHYME